MPLLSQLRPEGFHLAPDGAEFVPGEKIGRNCAWKVFICASDLAEVLRLAGE